MTASLYVRHINCSVCGIMINTLTRTGNKKIEKMVIGTILAHALLGIACFAAEPQSAVSRLGGAAGKISINMPLTRLPSFCPDDYGQIILQPITPDNPALAVGNET